MTDSVIEWLCHCSIPVGLAGDAVVNGFLNSAVYTGKTNFALVAFVSYLYDPGL